MTNRFVAALGCSAAVAGSCTPAASEEAARSGMVERQLVARGIHDPRVLAAMRQVPRHEFVPPSHRTGAYDDVPLPIGQGQTISQPYVVAYMAEALDLRGSERVLEVGSGSGYAAAVLSVLAAEMYGIERRGIQELVLVRKVAGAPVARRLEAVRFVPLRPAP